MKTDIQLDNNLLAAIREMQSDNNAENLAEDLATVAETLSDQSADIEPINRVEYINVVLTARRFILNFRKEKEDIL